MSAYPGAGLAGRCLAATVWLLASEFSFATNGSNSPDAEANNTTTNDRLAKLRTKANTAPATFALDFSRRP